MTFEHQSKNKNILLIIAVIALLVGISFLAWTKYSPNPDPVFCTQEAKLCPDGSYVGRTGPNCEFKECPAPIFGMPPAGEWKTFDDTSRDINFRYPEKLTTKYMNVFDWPPQIQILNEPFGCTEAGLETSRAGRTERRTIDGREYCVTAATEGAAGSIYTQYAYALKEGSRTAILTFSIKAVQCGNYGDPQKTECENERAAFRIDPIIDRVAQTLAFSETQTNKPDQISSFEKCIQAGYPVMESYPRQCKTPDGRSFTESSPVFCTQEAKLCPDGSYVGRTGPNCEFASCPPMTSQTGTISGTVLLGPTCPVERIPPDPQCADKPYRTELVLTTPDGARTIKQFNSDENGKFRIDIRAGEYAIRSAAAANILPYCSSSGTVKVVPGKITNTTVNCDTGIR